MIEINVTNFLTVGLMALIFFAMAEVVKKKLGIGGAKTDEAKTA